MDRGGKNQIAMIAALLEVVCVWSSPHILQPFLPPVSEEAVFLAPVLAPASPASDPSTQYPGSVWCSGQRLPDCESCGPTVGLTTGETSLAPLHAWQGQAQQAQ